MKYVGIDWAHEIHVVAVVDEAGEQIASRAVKHTAGELAAFVEWLEGAAPSSEGRMIAIEAGAPLLSDILQKLGQPLFVLNPKVVDRYRDRFSPAGSKDDKKDARVLADILRTDSERLRPLEPESDLAIELRLVVRARSRLVDKRTALTNELIDALRHHFPVAVKLPGSRTDRWFLVFLRRFPDADSASAASLKSLRKILEEHRIRKWTAESLRAFLRSEYLPARKAVARVYARITADLAEQIQVLNSQIADIDREIETLLKRHPDRDLVLSLPGVRTIIAARMLSEIGDDRSRLPNHSSLQAMAGTAPVTRQSGKGKLQVSMRRACNGHLRNAMYLHALTSKAKSTWARAYYDHLRRHGRGHAMASRAVANKWAKILFAVLTKREPYSEEVHLENLRRSGVPWCPPPAELAA